jgi:hypothetical protein
MPQSDYPVIQIEPGWVLEPEALGSKRKFWFRGQGYQAEWLFKFPEKNTGQHWAEKIAAEVAEILDIPHARVELAEFQGTRGSTTESFARDGWELFHGNQILAGKVLGYDPDKKFQQSDHTLTNIFSAIDMTFPTSETPHIFKRQFAEFLVLDALIGNTDRHHENWGILRRRAGDGWEGMLAPTFDHASSFGRELLDANEGKCRERLLREGRVGEYAEKARGGIYWEVTDKHGLSPLELVRRAAPLYSRLFKSALSPLRFASRNLVQEIIDPVPADWMTPLQREFAIELICYNYSELQKIK